MPAPSLTVEDTWNLDQTFALVLGEGLSLLAANLTGHPADSFDGSNNEFNSQEEWRDALEAHAFILLCYGSDFDWGDEPEEIDAVQRALRFVHDRFFHLWS